MANTPPRTVLPDVRGRADRRIEDKTTFTDAALTALLARLQATIQTIVSYRG